MPYSKALMKSGAHFQDWTAIYVRFLCTLLNRAKANESGDETTRQRRTRTATVQVLIQKHSTAALTGETRS